MTKSQLTGPEMGELSGILRKAFTPAELEQLMEYRLDKQFVDYAPINGNYPDAAFKILKSANAQGWIAKLIDAAHSENPGNPSLYDFAQRFELTAVNPAQFQKAQQRVIRPENRNKDSAVWRTKLGIIEPSICRIEITTDQGAMVYGTGFLLGPNVLLTNYHVMEVVIAGEKGLKVDNTYSAKPENVAIRFDYKRLGAGVLNQGTEYRLDTDWKIDLSEDWPPEPDAPRDKLDYALLRVAGTPGMDDIAPIAGAAGKQRGWLTPLPAFEFANGTPLFILQHPQGSPLQLAFETEAILGMNPNKTRVRYNVNTDQGSSGSPCFNQDWELVALHHSGDPNFDPPHKPTYNEGIPIAMIMQSLAARGLGPPSTL
jgi:hypothetical protein